MEYSLLLDKKRKLAAFWISIIAFIFFILGMFQYMGIYGLIGILTILFFLVLTPFLYNRNKFFLILWLFIVPCFDAFRTFTIAGTYPQVYLATGLTIPVALFLINKEGESVLKKYPFVLYLILFLILMAANFFRPGTYFSSLTEILKVFIQIFIIFSFYSYVKSTDGKSLSKFINLIRNFIILNAVVAVFQRLTGIGLAMIEGVPRVSGLLGHPNMLAFIMVNYFPFAVYNLLKVNTKKDKVLWGISILFSILALILTMCKTLIFALFLQVFILFFFVNIKNKTKIIVSAVGAFVLFFALNYLLDLQIIELIIDRINNTTSMDWRWKVWDYLLKDINFANVWLGHGIDTAQKHINMIGGVNLMTHNSYLQLLYELGIVGVLLFVFPFLFIAVKFFSLFFKEKTSYKINYVLPILVIMSTFIDMSTSNNVFLRTSITFVYFFLTYFYYELIINKNKKDTL
jgi:O-antigen ligase